MHSIWIHEYENQNYIRFSIVANKSHKAVGTIEFFAKNDIFEGFGKVGVLRIDLVSTYEKESQISDILSMVDNHFYDFLEVATVITKAIPAAKQRVIALKRIGCHELKSNPIMPFEHYYVKAR